VKNSAKFKFIITPTAGIHGNTPGKLEHSLGTTFPETRAGGIKYMLKPLHFQQYRANRAFKNVFTVY
jgi:hypothetical protein